MIKQPFQIREAINPHYLSLLAEVARLTKEVSESTGLGADAIILEDFGSTLTQRSWTDETGYYITFRPHPLYSHMDKVKTALKALEEKFIKSFKNGKEPVVTVEDSEDKDSKITVAVTTGSYSIGD